MRKVLIALTFFALAVGITSVASGESVPDEVDGPTIDYRERGEPVAGAADSRRIELLLLLEADERGLARQALAASTPGSKKFRRYLEPGQIAKRFGAPTGVSRKVVDRLKRRGIEASAGPGRMWVEANPTVEQAEELFSTRIETFSARGTRFLAPATRPSLAEDTLPGVTGVVGLDSEPVIHRGPTTPVRTGRVGDRTASQRSTNENLVPATREQALEFNRLAREKKTSLRANLGTNEGCAEATAVGAPLGEVAPNAYTPPYTPNQIHRAYAIDRLHAKGLKGQGERIAVVEIDGFKRADLVDAAKCFGYRAPPTPLKLVGLKKPLVPGVETTLDLQAIAAAVPQTEEIRVVQAKGGPSQFLGMYRYLYGLPRKARPSVISSSIFANCEAGLAGSRAFIVAMERVAKMGAAMGISLLSAAGDTGSSGCAAPGNTSALGIVSVQYWSSSPWLTAIGGTNVTLNRGNGITEEVVWNDSPASFGGGGGGSSLFFKRPKWQRGPGVGERSMRSVPDLALLADGMPGWSIRCSFDGCDGIDGWTVVGGTSAAAPLTASIALLANQKARRAGGPRLGFLNPSIYQLARKPKARKKTFRDVVAIGNDLGKMIPADAGGGSPLGCCKAGPNYDQASGWGSIHSVQFAERMRLLAKRR